MLGFGDDAGHLRAFLAEGHLLRIPIGDACLVIEVPRYVPWSGAVLAAAAAGGLVAWRWMSARGGGEKAVSDPTGRASVARGGRGSLPSPRSKEGSAPRVSRRSRGASTARSASIRRRAR